MYNEKLEVKPLKKAYKAKYPSFLDKNPLEYPDVRPYPFSMKMIKAMSTAGFVGAIMLAPMTGCKTVDNKIKPFSTGNPFPLSAASVPYYPASFGTGLPSRVYGEEVTDFINKAFIAEGLTISKDTLITHENMKITVNAYNEKYNIGYIWMDYSNFGEGMISSNYRSYKQPSQRKIEKKYRERFSNNYKKYSENPSEFFRLNIYKKNRIAKTFKKELQEKISVLSNEKDRKSYFVKRYTEYQLAAIMSNYKERKLSEYVYNWQVDATTRFDDKIKTLAMLERFVGKLYPYYQSGSQELINALNLEIREIYRTKNSRTWKKRSESLITLLSTSSTHYGINRKLDYLNTLTDIIKSKPWEKRKKQFYKLKQIIDNKYISYKEALQIENASQNGEYFIAPISVRDRRTIYHTPMRPYDPDYNARAMELRTQIKEADSDIKRDSLTVLQNEINQERKATWDKMEDEARLKALKVLEADVRRYIQWAKSQQGY